MAETQRVDPIPEIARQAEAMLRTHADLVARFGIGVAPTFKQALNRVIARIDGESGRPVEGVTGARDSGL
jgi:hypothetical protein